MKFSASGVRNCLGWIVWMCLVPPLEASPKLAIVAADKAHDTAVDLLTVELGKSSQITLLERSQIQKVMQEQSIAALSAGDFLKLGRLLEADGILFLETVEEGERQFLALRLVAVKPGVVLRLRNYPLPIEKPVDWSIQAAKHFQGLFPKLEVLPKDAIPLSILTLRAPVKTAEAEALERQLSLLFQHRLLKEKEIFVLERQHLRDLTSEQAINAPPAELAFWSGRYLLDGIIDKNGFDQKTITINARLLNPQGIPSVEMQVEGSRTNLVALIDALAVKVLSGLKLPSAADWRPKEEADQFLEEARWALKWRLFLEAQNAAEASWVLGHRNKEAALIRIQAYKDANDLTPPLRLETQKRALELFYQDSNFLGTNLLQDYEWIATGFRSLESATALLKYFYETAETRWGNEEALAELRLAARQAAELFPPQFTHGNYRDFPQKLAELKWRSGGLWFERPEEIFPISRDILYLNHSQFDFPGRFGWTWEKRKQIPRLTRKFIAELIASTNDNVRLYGAYFEAIAPLESPGESRAASIQSLGQLIWDLRGKFFRGEADLGVLGSAEAKLGTATFSDVRHRLRMDYLKNTGPDDRFLALFHDPRSHFSNPPAPYSDSQARELVPLLDEYIKTKQPGYGPGAVRDYLTTQILKVSATGTNSIAITTAVSTPPPSVNGITQSPDALTVSYVGLDIKFPDHAPHRQFKLQDISFEHGKLWFHVGYNAPNAVRTFNRSIFVALDSQSGTTESIPWPEEFGIPDHFFKVTKNFLMVSSQREVKRFSFEGKQWETIKAPIETGARIVEVGDRFLLSTADSIWEMSLDGSRVHLLASGRRRPAASPLDTLGDFGYPPLYVFSNLTFGVLVKNHLFVCDLPSRTWKEIALSNFGKSGFGPGPLPSNKRLILQVEDHFKKGWLFSFLNESESFQKLFDLPTRPGLTYSSPEIFSQVSLWKWPEDHSFLGSFVFAEGETLWALRPRQRWAPNDQGSKAADSRQATLLYFEPGNRDPVSVPIEFQKDGKKVDPMDSFGQAMRGLMWLSSPAGPVIANPGLAGFWRIPRADLENRFELPRQLLRETTRKKIESEKKWKTELMARFDQNRDGQFDSSERLAMLLDEPFLEHDRSRIDANTNGLLDEAELSFFDVNTNKIIELPEQEAIAHFHSVLASEAIARHDRNQDGSLDQNEWFSFLRAPGPTGGGSQPLPRGRDEFDRPFIASFDRNLDHRLEKNEIAVFLGLRSSRLNSTNYHFALRKDLEPFDQNQNGKLEPNELQAMHLKMRTNSSPSRPITFPPPKVPPPKGN